MVATNNTPPVRPGIRIETGTRFGHRVGPPWKRQTRLLVEAAQPVTVGPGLHLFAAPNGSGKTTLLRTVAGLAMAVAGRLQVEGKVLYFSDELRMDEELKPRTLFRAMFEGGALKHAEKLAETLKLNVDCPVGRLSRGNRQKVLLIMAETQVQQSAGCVLLMDEPLSGLDMETRETVTRLWAASGAQALRLVVLHELESVSQADSMLTIHEGVLRHALTRTGDSWMETYQALRR